LARASKASLIRNVEDCWILVGQRRGRIWMGRRMRATAGDRASVTFDGAWVLDREECKRDVIGFLHTHPDGPDQPSQRDVRTMRAWTDAFGKPLMCVIASPRCVRGFRFDGFESTGEPLQLVEMFPRGVIIGVDCDGG
jgi:proteasome lid subunit RPN8/RPN11